MREILTELDDFFRYYKATVIGVRGIHRDNFERFPAPGNGELRALSFHVVFHDVLVFGDGGDFLTDIHPRIAALGERLAERLRGAGIEITGPGAEDAVAIVPYPDPRGTGGLEPVPPSQRRSRGFSVIPPRELRAHSPYYARLLDTYGPVFGVLTTNGTVVGPDGGLLGAAAAAAEAFPDPLRVVELGMGAGSTPLALAQRGKLAAYTGNDFSAEMIEHFRRSVAPELDALGVRAEAVLGSCLDAPLPPADLLCVGVYYQAQPSLVAARGAELAAALGESGVAVFQSGMLEDPLVTRLLYGDAAEHSAWPWYDPAFRLQNYFRWIGRHVVEQETILIATNSLNSFRAVSRTLDRASGFRDLSLS
ncbi:methyltransferase domain-containing protein [Streptosporangium sp. CA-135522]|uniref:methyltransferase domain-containing protein n=1 Tax=Streptosporangium sp. CA-135522 TaxID=3240072 RepID=UPI003D8E1034